MAGVRSVHKINLADRDDVFLVSDYQPEKKLCLTLLDVNKCEAFSGSATDTELRSHAATIRMSFSTFIDLTTHALSQNEYDGLRFLYCLEKNCHDFLFKWKSLDSDETQITIGVVKMCKNEYQPMMNDVLLLLSKELLDLNKKVLDVEADLINSHKEKEDAIHLLAEATKMRERIENELYAKFILVLNEKKRKFRELSNITCSMDPKRIKFTETGPRSKFHRISTSDSDEVDGNLVAANVPGPSTAKRDDSLPFPDDDESKISVSPSKVRNRNVAPPTAVKDLSQGVQATLSRICDSDTDEDLMMNL